MNAIGVIGFGKIGQAIAANMLLHGATILALDHDSTIAEAFQAGTYATNEPGVEDILVNSYKARQLKVTDDFSALKNVKAVILSLPLSVDAQKKTVDTPFTESLQRLSPYCTDRMLIVVETSVPVGYCRHTLLPALEGTGKKHGIDFLLAHSPERIKSGTMLKQLQSIPKIIGGINADAANSACTLYKHFFKNELLHCLESIEAAEMLKLAGMIYRDVNIALSNQLAMFADRTGIDFPALLNLINTDGEAHLLYPGIGVAGHCTPVYPYFLIDNFSQAGLDFSLAATSRSINDSMPAYALSIVKDQLSAKTALILGLAFRPGVKEDANSNGAQLYKVLTDEGFDVYLHDAEYSASELIEKGFKPGDPAEAKVEVVFLVTMHSQYQQLDFAKMAANGVRYIVDGRNVLPKEKVIAAGIHYTGIGR